MMFRFFIFFLHISQTHPNFQVWTSPEIIPMDDSLDPSSQYIMQATKNNRDVAIAFTNGLVANGGTNINSAMLRGLELAKENLERVRAIPKNENTQAMVVFLTDGVPTSGVTSKPMIKSNIVEANELKMPLHCLAFGRDADFKLMKEATREVLEEKIAGRLEKAENIATVAGAD